MNVPLKIKNMLRNCVCDMEINCVVRHKDKAHKESEKNKKKKT